MSVALLCDGREYFIPLRGRLLCAVSLTRRAVGASAYQHGASDPEQLFVTRDQVIPNYPTRHESLPHYDASLETPVCLPRPAALESRRAGRGVGAKPGRAQQFHSGGGAPAMRSWKLLISQSGRLASLRRHHCRV